MDRSELLKWAMYRAPLHGVNASRDRLILVHLVMEWNPEHDAAFPTIREIAAALSLSIDTVRRGLRSLELQEVIMHEANSDAVKHIPANRRPQVWKFPADAGKGR